LPAYESWYIAPSGTKAVKMTNQQQHLSARADVAPASESDLRECASEPLLLPDGAGAAPQGGGSRGKPARHRPAVSQRPGALFVRASISAKIGPGSGRDCDGRRHLVGIMLTLARVGRLFERLECRLMGEME
jgi:hypothetical protein